MRMDKNQENPEEQASESSQSAEKEQPKFQEISEEDRQILEDHKLWVESDGNEGKFADLSRAILKNAILEGVVLRNANLRGADLQRAKLVNANLQEADLRETNLQEAYLNKANLQQAILRDANLHKANLWSANLQEADLWGAKLRKAYLREANLQKASLWEADLEEAELWNANLQQASLRRVNLQRATLSGTILREANLQQANLTEAKDLLSEQFAGTNVSGAKLPPDIHKFEGTLRIIEETSKNARKIFFAMLLGCVYSWLTIATTTDVRLLTNTASSPLPIIGTEIPIAWFYVVAPLVLICLYFYFHLYLDNLWKGLAGLPAIFPDGKPLDQTAYPWLLNTIVCRHFIKLKKRPIIAHMKEWITILLAWWVVPFTMIGFWLRYIPRHDWKGTYLHIALLTVSIFVASIFYHSAAKTLRGEKSGGIHWKMKFKKARNYIFVANAFLLGLLLYVLSFGAIEGVNYLMYIPGPGDETLEDTTGVGVIEILVPYAFQYFAFGSDIYPFADLYEANVSTKPINWTGQQDQVSLVKGARLTNGDLRWSFAARSFLVNADLRGSNLSWSILNDADLRGANFGDRLLGLHPGANLQYASLSRSKLKGAQLVGADLRHSILRSADFRGADFMYTSLDDADLQGADLREVEGLNKKQIKRARNWPLAHYSHKEIKLLDLYSDHNERVKNKNLADLNLSQANLKGANLKGANLDRVNLEKADLKGANLNGAKLRGAKLRGVKNLTISQLKQVLSLHEAELDLNLMEQIKKDYPHLLEKPKEE
jgi:uncharacterized protein YjbI with pentapeptide repeats